jgi:hypothetical protein
LISNHTLNTLLLSELTSRRLRSRMGIVYTTANRNWESHLALVKDRLRQSRALVVDMESVTVAANGFRYRIPTATLLAVSDKPLHAQPKLSADAQSFYADSRRQHVEIAISVAEYVRRLYPGDLPPPTSARQTNRCSAPPIPNPPRRRTRAMSRLIASDRVGLNSPPSGGTEYPVMRRNRDIAPALQNRAERRVGVRFPGQCPSLSVTV